MARAVFGPSSTTDSLPELVRIGARYRPMHTGGGLICMGRLRPEVRPPRQLPEVRGWLIREITTQTTRGDRPPNTKTSMVDDFYAGALRGFPRNPFETARTDSLPGVEL